MNLTDTKKQHVRGHLTALLTVIIWGTTFISTKVLLWEFTPLEILVFRFGIAYIMLWIFCPRRLTLEKRRQEWYFVFAGLTGITSYFLLENIALTYTYASNVGIVLAAAPVFTMILCRIFLKDERLRRNFFIGFVLAMAGILVVSYNGSEALKLNPLGDILAVAAAFVWGAYSVLIKKIGEMGYHVIQTTRRTFFYGLLFMIPAAAVLPFRFGAARFTDPVIVGNFLFLGMGASALCFVSWNVAVGILGAVRTSVYIYLAPVVTIAMSVLILHEKITGMSLVGTLIIFAGLVISEKR